MVNENIFGGAESEATDEGVQSNQSDNLGDTVSTDAGQQSQDQDNTSEGSTEEQTQDNPFATSV